MTKIFSYRILHDEDCANPREFDNLGQLALYPNHYLRSELDIDELPDKEEVAMIFSLDIYLNAGIFFSAVSERSFNDVFDGGNAGYVIVTYKQVEKIYGGNYKNMPDLREKISKSVKLEIVALNAYMNGDCWAYQIFDGEDDSGRMLDSCCGFYSYEDAENEAKAQIKYWLDNSIQPTLFYIEPVIDKLDDILLTKN